MKSEAEIRKMLRYLNDINDTNFNDDSTIYTSADTDEEAFDEEESSSVLGNIQMASYVLEWILEEGQSLSLRPIKNENEASEVRLHKGEILLDGDGKQYVKDTSIDTFIARVEGAF